MSLKSSISSSRKTRSIYSRKNKKNTKEKNKEIVRVVKEIKKARIKVLRDKDQQVEKELVLKKEKVYIQKNEDLRTEIIQLYHNVPVARYKERQKTIELVMKNYQQLEVMKDVGEYECNLCQKMKNRTEVPMGKLIVNEILEKL